MDSVSALPLGMEAGHEGDEVALIAAARTEPAAFGELYKRYLGRVYGYLRARTSSDEDAADLAQQVFIRAMDALPRYQPRGVPFAAWLFQIARNAVIDSQRRRRVTVSWELAPEALLPRDEQDPESIALRREAARRVRAILEGLDAEKRELLMLRYVAGLTVRETASVVGKKESAVNKQLTRTLQAIKEQHREEQ